LPDIFLLVQSASCLLNDTRSVIPACPESDRTNHYAIFEIVD